MVPIVWFWLCCVVVLIVWYLPLGAGCVVLTVWCWLCGSVLCGTYLLVLAVWCWLCCVVVLTVLHGTDCVVLTVWYLPLGAGCVVVLTVWYLPLGAGCVVLAVWCWLCGGTDVVDPGIEGALAELDQLQKEAMLLKFSFADAAKDGMEALVQALSKPLLEWIMVAIALCRWVLILYCSHTDILLFPLFTSSPVHIMGSTKVKTSRLLFSCWFSDSLSTFAQTAALPCCFSVIP